jgi:hypothetical protein
MTHAQMIARAWLDDSYRAALVAQGLEVPPRPEDLADDQLNVLTADGREYDNPAPQSCCC